MLFWIVATVIALAVTTTLVVPLLRSAPGPATQADTVIYRDQLAEVDRDLARGLLDAEEAERARTEISRRLLDADRSRRTPGGEAPGRTSRIAGAVVGVIVIAGGLAIYDRLGAPGYPDMPRMARIAQSEEALRTLIDQAAAEQIAATLIPVASEADLPPESRALIAQMREIVAANPDDMRGWQLLSDYEASLGRFAAAARAREQVVRIRGEVSSIPDEASLVDLWVLAAGGQVSSEASVLVRRILEQDADNPAARYYLGLLYAQVDRSDVAFGLWRPLAERGDPDSFYVRSARAYIEEAAFRAGLDYTLPETAGPTADDVAAMAELSPEDRAARIEGMVAGLSDRLATTGGSVEEWAQLIRATAMLGDLPQAEAIWREARGVFGASDAAMALLDETAERVGIVP